MITAPQSSRREQNVMPPRRDLELEPLVEILEGKRYVHAHCYRADEILMLINLADEFGFKIRTFQHVLEGYKVATEIARHGAMASAFADFWGYKMEAYDAIPYDRADHDPAWRRVVGQFGLGRARAPFEYRSREDDSLRRADGR